MATKKEQEELMETLKWTPRTYNISIYGYGGEIAMGRIEPGTVDYFKENLISVENYATSWADEGDDDYIEVPEDLKPFEQGSWYDCDGIEHCSGAEFGGCTIQVSDENGNVVWEQELGHNLEEEGCEIDCFCEEAIDEHVSAEKAVFVGQSFEKGTFFDGELELKQPFDPAKFKFTYSDIAGWNILNVVEYDGEDIDGSGGYSTTGKSMDFNFYYDNDGEVETYNSPSDEELGVPDYGTSPDEWESSPKFKFKQHKPVYQGWYTANWGYGSTFGSLYWNGENFVEFDYGKERVVDPKGIVTWQGYNWDTTSWANRPPEPPNLICSNKKCGWIGKSEDRIEDDEYNDHCPECNGTEFDWIDYDPDTAKGRKNREKYCIPALPPMDEADLEQALEELKSEFEALSIIEAECVQCDWRGAIDDTHDNDGEMCCPECGEPVEIVENGSETINDNPWNDVSVKPPAKGTYEVKNTHTPVWPFPASFQAEWTGRVWRDSDGDKVENVIEWRAI